MLTHFIPHLLMVRPAGQFKIQMWTSSQKICPPLVSSLQRHGFGELVVWLLDLSPPWVLVFVVFS